METLIKFFDDVEDMIIAATWRVKRLLSRRPKERRLVPRTHMATPQSQHSGPVDEDEI
jgi:hypothetical protein